MIRCRNLIYIAGVVTHDQHIDFDAVRGIFETLRPFKKIKLATSNPAILKSRKIFPPHQYIYIRLRSPLTMRVDAITINEGRTCLLFQYTVDSRRRIVRSTFALLWVFGSQAMSVPAGYQAQLANLQPGS